MASDRDLQYTIRLDDKFGQLHEFDVLAEADAVEERWFNQTLTTVNDAVVRLGVVEGEFHWHAHDEDDEFFYVVAGELVIEIEGREPATLRPGQAITIPRAVRHRPRAAQRTVILMVEPATVRPTGDEGSLHA
jgi:mannose-6-phosphate isomerase-like protein (cupin superfamily)